MKTANFKMLKLARESRGYTQTDLARITKIEQGNLSKMEKGISKITDDTLSKIAEKLEYPVSFFYKTEPKLPTCSFYYRKRQAFPKKELSLLEAKMDIIRLTIDELLSSVEIPNYNLPAIQPDSSKTPEDIARHVRYFLNIQNGPIEKPIEVLESSGVLIYFLDFDSDQFDGITLFTNSGCPIMFINAKMPNDRKRFTIGHELGHLIMHIPFKEMNDPYQAEREADSFSAEFNMPALDCRNDLSRIRFKDLDDIKSYWKMSKAAILFRAKELKLINEQTYKYMIIELTRRGERKSETGIVPLDLPKMLRSMVSLYKTDLNYSDTDLTTMLGLSIKDFNEYFNPTHRLLKIA
jgi:Zn-dependent peptidase ImmA (M78 family)/DNA-binding Xre family transcriptional regulator